MDNSLCAHGRLDATAPSRHAIHPLCGLRESYFWPSGAGACSAGRVQEFQRRLIAEFATTLPAAIHVITQKVPVNRGEGISSLNPHAMTPGRRSAVMTVMRTYLPVFS